MPDSDDDYEIMPKHEIEKLRRELAAVKHRTSNPVADITSISDLYAAINRLNSSINKFIAILEDAQQDIVAEYQQSKPAEKLNQIIDQNETIAKAILSLNDTITGAAPNPEVSEPAGTNIPEQDMPPSRQFPPEFQSSQSGFQMPQGGMPFGAVPPLDTGMPNPSPGMMQPEALPEHKKKKFLGFI